MNIEYSNDISCAVRVVLTLTDNYLQKYISWINILIYILTQSYFNPRVIEI